jgi:Ca-activated chloride channel family protein
MAGRARRSAVAPQALRLLSGLLLALGTVPALAQSGMLVPTSTGRQDPAVLSLREMTIDASIARGYARVNVRQIFENHTDSIQEGTYRFALGPSAAVGDFAVWDGLVRIPGVILEKRRARAIYEALNTQRVDPGLLQQGEEEDREPGSGRASSTPSGTAPFSVKVAPIPARATKRLELQFQQDISVVGLTGEFRMVLAPVDGEPLTASTLRIRVSLNGLVHEASANGLPLRPGNDGVTFEGTNVKLDRDLIVRFKLGDETPLRLSAFRNPDGRMPDGLALAPWERPADIPPEKDGFFLMEVVPPQTSTPTTADKPAAAARRAPLSVAVLFDTSLSHRFSGLEMSYQRLVRLLSGLTPDDKFALIPFDANVDAPAALASAIDPVKTAALDRLRNRPLSPGTSILDALRAAKKLVGDGDKGRLVLFTDGVDMPSSKELNTIRAKTPLFTSVATPDAGPPLRGASAAVVTALSSEPETDLFFDRLLSPIKTAVAETTAATSETPLRATLGDPGLRDIYPVMVQPPTPRSLSGYVGRYAKPAAQVRFALASGILPREASTLTAALPERALEARDLPRRWARARVDDLLRRIEAEGERREWVDEIIELSRRYKFVTPYTAFLAAPRSLLRPRRIQPGDPVLRVECDEGTVVATALLPFGLKLPLVRRPHSNLFEGRFLVPDSLKDGRYSVEIVMRDKGGRIETESKTFVIDGQAPHISPRLPRVARVGDDLILSATTDDDVIFFSVRVGNLPPVPLRWDKTAQASIGRLHIPASAAGAQEVVFEAVDAAKNVGFARATLEVRP